jgi:hypothetical protein
MRKFFILIVWVIALPSIGQAISKQSRQARSTNRLSRSSAFKPPPTLFGPLLGTVSDGVKDPRYGYTSNRTSASPSGRVWEEYVKQSAIGRNAVSVILTPEVKPRAVTRGWPPDLGYPRFNIKTDGISRWATSVPPPVVAGTGVTGYVFTNLSKEEMTKRLIQLGVHQKRIPGIIKLLKKPTTRGALFAVAVTGATAYVYQHYQDHGRQAPDKSKQSPVQQQPSKEEVKTPPGEAAQSPAQDNQPRGYNKYTVGGIAGVVALFAFFMARKYHYLL